MMLERAEAIDQMNQLGSEGLPFFFFTDFLGTKAFVRQLGELDLSEVAFDFEQKSTEITSDFTFTKSPISYEAFLPPFQYVVDQINYGNSYLVNLTFETPIKTNLSLKEIYERSSAQYKVCFADQFVVFSPETFVKIKNGQIFSYPMKGTIDASLSNAENVLMNDPKEIAEHVTIVDLIRNDLSQIAKKVSVPKFRFVSEVHTHEKTLLQVSSEIRGDLPEDYQASLGTMLFQLLPAGSISGAPKKETVRIIQEAENYERGFYTGICGVFDGKNLDSGVMIRFIENQNGQLVYKSGGGITSFSKAKSEYQEIIDKVYLPK
ncbi:aminodeoxychorismate synthase component I [Marinoscillum sp.]|uniref:aminodeoxychorismate synthase component I n=1 Tax=Marinoscillum sp. TaxID=2024838 RepID=UPI003BAB342E